VAEWVIVSRTDEIPAGSAKVVEIRDRFLAIFHRADGWFCIDNTCPHRGGSLAGGEIVGNDVLCPWHSWPFSLIDGKSAGSDFWRVGTYPVNALDGVVRVEVPDRWPDQADGLVK